jgi:serralysin
VAATVSATFRSGNPIVDGLLTYYHWSPSQLLRFGFPAGGAWSGYPAGSEPYVDYDPVTAAQQAAVSAAFNAVESFTNLAFLNANLAGEAPEQATFRFGRTGDTQTAHAYFPFPDDERAGDVWFANDGTYDSPVRGDYAYVTVLHEIGHALGLKHPHDTGFLGATPLAYDNLSYTVMSYRSYYAMDVTVGYGNGQFGFPQTYMMYDIAALQYLYGADFTYNNGNSLYQWSPATGSMSVDGIVRIAPGANVVFMTLWDGGGIDTYDFSAYANALSVSLVPGDWTKTADIQLAYLGDGHYAIGNIANALLYNGDTRSLIENAIGGSGNDQLIGNQAANMLTGGGGSDWLDGGTGADQLIGGTGNDIYVVDDAGDTVTELPGEGTDEIRTGLAVFSLAGLANVENLRATSDIAHDFRGNGGNNVLTGAGGPDTFRLQDGGMDTAIGGDGNDFLFFGASLDALDAIDGGAGIDQVAIQGNYNLTLGSGLVSIESLIPLPGSDTRFGDSGANFYDYALTTVDANVGAGQRLTVDANRLRAGEDFTFNGSAETDGEFFLIGGGGVDTLTGGAKNDTFLFGENNQFGAGDTVNGGSGGTNDQLGLRGNYTIIFGANQLIGIESIALVSSQDTRFGGRGLLFNYNLTMNDGNVAAGQLMTVDGAPLRSNEILTFNGSLETNGSYRVAGGAAADTITGGAQADILIGRAGGDMLRGGGGNDLFRIDAAGESNAAGRDQILDFASGDRIDLSRMDANSAVAGDQAFIFIGSAAFGNHAGELRFENQSGNIWLIQGDTDGNGIADFEVSVTIVDLHPITAADFIL